MSRTPPSGGLHPEIDLPHEQEWELYNNSFSLCSKKLRVCMAELELPYAHHPIDLIETGSYENVSRAFLAVNPAGTVPVLVHEGHPVYESHDQIVYAAEHAGALGRSLLPEHAEARAVVEHWTDCASIVGDAVRGTAQRAGHCIPGLTLPMFATMVPYIPYSEILRGLLTHPNKERPLIFATLKLMGVERIPRLKPAFTLMQRSREHMGEHLDALAKHLDQSGGDWIAGDTFTLADVSWVVVLDRLVEADWHGLFWGQGRRPTIAAYWERLRGRPSFSRAIEEARDDTIRRGMADLRTAKERSPELRRSFEGDSA